jgi:hypothetical protein
MNVNDSAVPRSTEQLRQKVYMQTGRSSLGGTMRSTLSGGRQTGGASRRSPSKKEQRRYQEQANKFARLNDIYLGGGAPSPESARRRRQGCRSDRPYDR